MSTLRKLCEGSLTIAVNKNNNTCSASSQATHTGGRRWTFNDLQNTANASRHQPSHKYLDRPSSRRSKQHPVQLIAILILLNRGPRKTVFSSLVSIPTSPDGTNERRIQQTVLQRKERWVSPMLNLGKKRKAFQAVPLAVGDISSQD